MFFYLNQLRLMGLNVPNNEMKETSCFGQEVRSFPVQHVFPVRRVDMFTVRPASLLWRFIAERASGRFSLASANSLDTSTPNSASSLQPPHFQPSPGGPLWWESQPHMVDVPSAQERVTANATPAEAMAWTKADSRVAETDEMKTDRKERGRDRVSNMDVAILNHPDGEWEEYLQATTS